MIAHDNDANAKSVIVSAGTYIHIHTHTHTRIKFFYRHYTRAKCENTFEFPQWTMRANDVMRELRSKVGKRDWTVCGREATDYVKKGHRVNSKIREINRIHRVARNLPNVSRLSRPARTSASSHTLSEYDVTAPSVPYVCTCLLRYNCNNTCAVCRLVFLASCARARTVWSNRNQFALKKNIEIASEHYIIILESRSFFRES